MSELSLIIHKSRKIAENQQKHDIHRLKTKAIITQPLKKPAKKLTGFLVSKPVYPFWLSLCLVFNKKLKAIGVCPWLFLFRLSEVIEWTGFWSQIISCKWQPWHVCLFCLQVAVPTGAPHEASQPRSSQPTRPSKRSECLVGTFHLACRAMRIYNLSPVTDCR